MTKKSSENDIFSPFQIKMHGNKALLDKYLVGFSTVDAALGSTVLKAYELGRKLRDKKISVIGRFSNYLEKEVLYFLLKGDQPIIIVCSVSDEIPFNDRIKKGIEDGRVLLVKIGKTSKDICKYDYDIKNFISQLSSETIFLDNGTIKSSKKSKSKVAPLLGM